MGLLPVTLEKGEPPNLPHATTFSLAALTSASAGQVKEELGLGPGQMGGAFPLDGSKQNMRQTSSHMGRDHQVSFHIFIGILGQELTLGIPNPISGMIIFIAKLTSVLSPLQDFERI